MFGYSLPENVTITTTPIDYLSHKLCSFELLAMSLIRLLVFYLDGYMKRLIFGLVDFQIGPVRYHLSDVEFDEPIYIEACQRANHLVANKYHLCKIFALLFEYACELVICFFDFVLVQVPVFGKVPVR